MVDAPVVPDGQVVGIAPPEPHLQVVVLLDELHEPAEDALALLVRQPVDALHVVAHAKHRLPPRHRVRADQRVRRLEGCADVLGGPARRGVDGEAVARGRVGEARLGVVRCQGVEEGPQGRGDAVVELVA